MSALCLSCSRCYWIGQKVVLGFKPKLQSGIRTTEIKVHTYTVPGLKLPESLKGKQASTHGYDVIEVHIGYYGSIDEVMVSWNDPGK